MVERILPAIKAFEEPKPVSHAIEIVLKKPEWMKLEPPQPVTVEHDSNDTQSSDFDPASRDKDFG